MTGQPCGECKDDISLHLESAHRQRRNAMTSTEPTPEPAPEPAPDDAGVGTETPDTGSVEPDTGDDGAVAEP